MMMKTALVASLMVASAGAQGAKAITVAPPGSKPAGDYTTVQDAVTAAPETGGEIRIRPGVYREVVHIDKPNIRLVGETTDASKVVIVDDMGDPKTCGTFCSPTMFVTGDGFFATHLTISNDLSKTGKVRTQGVALSITSDKAVLRDVRLLGAQDTLYAASKGCHGETPCQMSRQYYEHCYIEGEVDFIFGNAKAEFEGCELHSVTHNGGYLTAQSRLKPEEDSGYVFNHCTTSADPGVSNVFLGRPWRDHATVIFMNTQLGAHIAPEGFSPWRKGETEILKTATYAEFNSTGPGAHPKDREPEEKKLTAEEAKQYETKVWLGGTDHWDPTTVK